MPRRNVRFRSECVAKLFAALRSRNDRIRLDGTLNQCCAFAFAFESILPVLAVKIVLQHIRGKSGHAQYRAAGSLNEFFRTEKFHYAERQLICRDFRKDCIDSPTSARATTPVRQARSSSACGPSLRVANASLKARRISPMSSGCTQIRTRLRSPVCNAMRAAQVVTTSVSV
jgi:hypothetical protein